MSIKKWEKILKFWRTKLNNSTARQWILGIFLFLGLYGILMINIAPTAYNFTVGEVARFDVKVPRDMENRAQTLRNQEEAGLRAVIEAQNNPENYEINQAVILSVEQKITALFTFIKEKINFNSEDETSQAITSEELRVLLDENWQVHLPTRVVAEIMAATLEEYEMFSKETTRIVVKQMNQRITDDNLPEIRDQLRNLFEDSDIKENLREAAYLIGGQVLTPNLKLNQEKVEQAKQEAIKEVEPVLVKAGEIIISDGTIVRPEHIQLLKDLGLYREGLDFKSLSGLGIILFALLALLGVYLYKYGRNVILSENKLALLCSVLVVVTFITKILSFVQWNLAAYLSPIALGGILVTILLDSRIGTITVLVLSVITVIVHNSLVVAALCLIGGVVAILSVSQVSQRGELMRAGFIVGGTNVLVMIAFGLLQGDTTLIIHSYLGILNGLISSIITIGSLPYFESIFNITSGIRLLELSNPNQPLLRRLLMETPGTYHHSILVGNLAEAAAEAVGADGLLARVGSTYHDLGKLKRPYFFAENQFGIDNPHDKIAPSLSTLIITSHVKDGIELARENKLPDVVIDFIAQHHGTDLVKFFYHRAKENDGENIQEKDFRYPGPKPQTKETAIVSLADAVEAAVRSLVKPTPGKIEALVRKIIRDRLDDGQLDESDLTFKDLNKIAEAFVKVLNGIYHARVEYPENITREEIEGKNKG
ncbi:MAG: HDIG domain-containing protein [Firmicutes bacterium]|mgnify:CR=1 FL=1|nr:HDIG domain-containing protein [Bacillota bacterium]